MCNAIELASFKLKQGVSIEDFLLAADRFNKDYVSLRKGYVSRKLLRTGDTWYELVLWETMHDAKSAYFGMLMIWVTINDTQIAVDSTPGNNAAIHYLSFVDGESTNIHHLIVEKNY